MKISNKNKVNFTSVPINQVKVKCLKGTDFVHQNAIISKLTPNCAEDLQAIKNIKTTWAKISSIANAFCTRFLSVSKDASPYEYYALEIPQKNSSANKIVGLFNTVITDENDLKLDYIVTASDFCFKKSERQFKGIGEVMFGGICNLAKEKSANCVRFFSTNMGFYNTTLKNAHIQKYEDMKSSLFSPNSSFIRIYPNAFEKYTNYIEQKYNFKFPLITKPNPQ